MKNTALFFLTLSLFFACQPADHQVESDVLTKNVDSLQLVPVAKPTIEYGLVVDSLDRFEGKIRWGQTLSDVLDDFNVSPELLYQLSRNVRSVYSVRKLKANQPFVVLHGRDSLKTAAHFVFEPDPRRYVVYHLKDSIYADIIEKPVEYRDKEIVAEVKTSVYDAILDAGATPLLVSKLVDVLAWQVDFFRIQRGDNFKVIYEEEVVEGEPVGIRNIIGVYFQHMDREYYGFYYQQEKGKVDYFDEYGNSLRKTFLRAPVNYSRISSRFTPRRYHPVLKRYKAHLGTDYAAPRGTPIVSTGDGVVLEARYGKYNGNFVKIKHNSNYTTQYLHMYKIRGGIHPGKVVKQGEVIGYVGSTGLANGPHVCYRFWKNGRQVDALNVDLPPTEPIDASQLHDFLHYKNVVLKRLKNIKPREQKIVMAKIPS
jgi:murein DD-endopeptidase MepM/ murein hydrolase activator NlpD